MYSAHRPHPPNSGAHGISGAPLVADQVYGGGIHATMSRQALHAVHLSFVHPHTLEQKAFDAPLPADFKALLHAWGLRYNPPTRVVNP